MKKVQHVEKVVSSEKPEIQPMPQKPKVEKEKCVSCGKETIYPKNMNIELRDYYVEGAGQLCMDCYFDIFDNRKRNH